MPTPLDRALSSKNAVLAFTGIVTAAAAWSIWGTDMFPKEEDPTGDPETWSREELRRWLAAVKRSSSTTQGYQRAAVREGKGKSTSAKKVIKAMIPSSCRSFQAGESGVGVSTSDITIMIREGVRSLMLSSVKHALILINFHKLQLPPGCLMNIEPHDLLVMQICPMFLISNRSIDIPMLPP
ncbi:hypothetical protein BCIN_05g06060 [Botrytis cinerea B05.10]|uniref:Uncharacterized protein n=1 Tax=Botryotinia fuckeliana (strain B05.10) TaxID=332648 RepID=A0A384JIK9_BOTFB|nr:hypothetical protein BCIN_05g06060 [Botrytis cinerea B05.10]ATZ50237.1 hypothetical protein BCIN_05g06060 [Botrytis cinerea B05.10]